MSGWAQWSSWDDRLIAAGAILLVALVLTRVIGIASHRLERRIVASDGPTGALQRRAQTLASVLRSSLRLVVWLVAVVSIINQAGVAVGPILAAAGVVGVALGLGAQHLVRDFLGGFMILLENQYDVGDAVEIASVAGTVEAVNLRTTVLRAEDGARHVIPNGEVRVSSNLTKRYSRYPLTLTIPYDQDLSRAMALAREVARELEAEAPYDGLITDGFRVLGVDGYASGGLQLVAYIETAPGAQMIVGRELRARLARAFAEEGIPLAP